MPVGRVLTDLEAVSIATLDRYLTVRTFTWADWPPLLDIRSAQVAEYGIEVDPTEVLDLSHNC